MSREVGIGAVGLGWMGQLHTRAYRRLLDHFPDSELRPRLMIAAEAEDRAQKSASRLGYEHWTTDWREVVEHPEVEAVSITVPNFLHRDVAVAAAEAGKHVWLEKPCGRFPAETFEIGRAVEEAGVKSMIGLMYRHAPAVEHAKSLITSGALGEITLYRGLFLADYARDPRGPLSWRYLREYSGSGALGDIMTHVADMAQNLVGPIVRLVSQQDTFIKERAIVPMGAGQFDVAKGGEMGPVENDDYVGSLVQFANGARGTLEVCRSTTGPHVGMSFEVHGTQGALSWHFQRMNELQRFTFGIDGDDSGYRAVYPGPGIGYFGNFQPSAGISMGYDDLKVIEAHRFLSSIADGRQREPSMREAVEMMQVIDAMERSWDSQGWESVAEMPSQAVRDLER